MDCDLDQAGGPSTTPHLDPYWLKHSYTITDTHGPLHIHIILKGECVQLQGETWQRRDQLSSRQMTQAVGGLIIFLPQFETMLLSAADNWSPPLYHSPLFMVQSTSKKHFTNKLFE